VTLVHLRLRRGEAVAEERLVEGAALYFCAKDACPHYRGQLGLLEGAEAMLCTLVQHPPDRICQPFYLEQAEDLDKLRRQSWQQRLEEAEAFESAIAAASTMAPRERSLSPTPGGEGQGEGGGDQCPLNT
jgi:hypothetical protein